MDDHKSLTLKSCTKCGVHRPLDEFYKPPNRNHYWNTCQECLRARRRARTETKKVKDEAYKIRRRTKFVVMRSALAKIYNDATIPKRIRDLAEEALK